MLSPVGGRDAAHRRVASRFRRSSRKYCRTREALSRPCAAIAIAVLLLAGLTHSGAGQTRSVDPSPAPSGRRAQPEAGSLERQIADRLLDHPIGGGQTVRSLNPPDPFLNRVVDRMIRMEYRRRSLQIADSADATEPNAAASPSRAPGRGSDRSGAADGPKVSDTPAHGEPALAAPNRGAPPADSIDPVESPRGQAAIAAVIAIVIVATGGSVLVLTRRSARSLKKSAPKRARK